MRKGLMMMSLLLVTVLCATQVNAQKQDSGVKVNSTKKPTVASLNDSVKAKDTTINVNFQGTIKVDTVKKVFLLYGDSGERDFNPVVWSRGYVVSRYVLNPNAPQNPIVLWVKFFTLNWVEIKQNDLIQLLDENPNRQ